MTLPSPEEIADEVDSSDVSLGGDWQWHHVVSSANLAFRAVAKELDRAHVSCQSDGNFRVVIMGFLRQQLDGEKVSR